MLTYTIKYKCGCTCGHNHKTPDSALACRRRALSHFCKTHHARQYHDHAQVVTIDGGRQLAANPPPPSRHVPHWMENF